MIPELGHFALILALLMAAAQLYPLLARQAAVLQALLCGFSFAALAWAYAVSDFTVVDVAENSHTMLPPVDRAISFVTHPAGAAMVLVPFLASVSAFVALRSGSARILRGTGLASVIAIAYTLFALNPFARIDPPPFDGMALDPLQQEVQLTTLPDFSLDGLAKNDIHGPALINFFASWCPPCEAEHPLLKKIAGDLPLYGIAFQDKHETVAAYLTRLGNPYRKLGYDADGNVATALAIKGVPTTLLIDKDDKIIYRHDAPLTADDLAEIEHKIGTVQP